MLSKICVSIAEKTYNEIITALNNFDFAEIRLDLSLINEDDIRAIFSSSNKKLIATCREGDYTKKERINRLKAAMESGAKYVDIEMEEAPEYRQSLFDIAKKNGCNVIISHHNFNNTPDKNKLDEIVAECNNYGADIVKLVTTANTPADCAKILSLYNSECDNLVAFAMGRAGQISRLACLYLGAPFSYASASDSKVVANGQLSVHTLSELINLMPLA